MTHGDKDIFAIRLYLARLTPKGHICCTPGTYIFILLIDKDIHISISQNG